MRNTRETGQQRQKEPVTFYDVATVECDKCDAEYVISHKRQLKRAQLLLRNRRPN
jgi:hypothetical protein